MQEEKETGKEESSTSNSREECINSKWLSSEELLPGSSGSESRGERKPKQEDAEKLSREDLNSSLDNDKLPLLDRDKNSTENRDLKQSENREKSAEGSSSGEERRDR
jgi:hypothetical protein